MMEIQLSETEQMFIVHGIQENLRNDGRHNDDYRPIAIETNVVQNTSGSSRVRLGSTDVLVGVKCEIDAPTFDAPDFGRLQFFVDCSANATPEFEGRGGDELAQDISDCLTKSYRGLSSELKKLCIVSKQLCWLLYVDVVILECGGGNIYDCVSLAVKCAMFDLKIPNVKAVYNEKEKADVEVSDDSFDVWRLNVEAAPVLVTVGKIGVDAVVDLSAEEEKCRKSALVVSVVGDQAQTSRSTMVKQSGGGGSLDPESIVEMMDMAMKSGAKLNEQLIQKLKANELRKTKPLLSGFLL